MFDLPYGLPPCPGVWWCLAEALAPLVPVLGLLGCAVWSAVRGD